MALGTKWRIVVKQTCSSLPQFWEKVYNNGALFLVLLILTLQSSYSYSYYQTIPLPVSYPYLVVSSLLYLFKEVMDNLTWNFYTVPLYPLLMLRNKIQFTYISIEKVTDFNLKSVTFSISIEIYTILSPWTLNLELELELVVVVK